MKNLLLFFLLLCFVGCGDKEPTPHPTSGTVGSITWEYSQYIVQSSEVLLHVLTISGSGDMPDFEQGEAPWAIYADRIEHVHFDGDITSTGSWAFSDLPKLKQVGLTKTVGAYAFANCTALERVWIGYDVNAIGAYAFSNCPALTEVTIETEVPPTLDEGNFTADGDVLHVRRTFSLDFSDVYRTDEDWNAAFSAIKGYDLPPVP